MIAFKLNNQKFNMPSSWHDLTFDQYIKIMEGKGTIAGMIEIVTGITEETLAKSNIEGLESVIYALSFLKTKPDFKGQTETLGKYKLPLNSKGVFDIQMESLAQFEDMRAIMMKVPENDIITHTKSYASYVAIYLQKLRDKVYNHDEALKMIDEVMAMPAHEVIKAGSFFFLKLWSLSTGTQLTSQSTSPNQKKSRRVSVNSKKRLAPSRQSRKRQSR